MPRKILILTNNSGGLYCFRRELIAELIKTNEVIASTPFDDKINELENMGCQLIQTEFERRGINPIKDLALLLTYDELIRAEKPDLVITYTIKPNIYGGMICRKRRIPYAVNITGLGTVFENQGYLRKLVVSMYRLALKKAGVVYFENSSNLQVLLSERILKIDQACLLNGAGVNLDYFSLQPYPQNSKLKFLFVGRIMREKGIDELFAAMKMLIEDGVNCSLDVLGGFDEDYSRTIKEYEEEGWLKYHGYQTDVRPFIRDCDCFVLPSWHEGMANTNLECAASGRPVITSNISGCKEAVIDGVSGLLCKPKDADSLYEAMKRMINISRSGRQAMGMAGRKHMEEIFDKRKVVEQTVEHLIN